MVATEFSVNETVITFNTSSPFVHHSCSFSSKSIRVTDRRTDEQGSDFFANGSWRRENHLEVKLGSVGIAAVLNVEDFLSVDVGLTNANVF